MNASGGKRSNRFWIGCGVAGGLILCGIGGTGLYFLGKVFDIGGASQRAKDGAVAYRAAGFAWEAKDITSQIALSDADNGAELFGQATKELHDLKTAKFTSDARKLELKSNWSSIQKQLEPIDGALELAKAVSKKKGIDFRRDWDMGTTLLFPEYSNAKFFVRGLCWRAEVESMNHQTAQAVDDLSAAWKLSKMIGNEPILISMLVECSCRQIVLESLVRCVELNQHSASTVQKYASIIKGDTSVPNFLLALRGEAYLQLSTIRNLSNMGGVQALTKMDSESQPVRLDPKTVIRTGLPRDIMSKAFAASHFEVWVEFSKSMKQYKDQPAKLSAELDREIEKVTSKKSVSNVLNSIIFPVFGQAGIAVTNAQANLCCTQALLAGLVVMDSKGNAPESIDEIPGGPWTDPFNQNSLIVKTQNGGFRVYSVGPNGKDDGGIFRPELKNMESQNYDIGASYPPLQRKLTY